VLCRVDMYEHLRKRIHVPIMWCWHHIDDFLVDSLDAMCVQHGLAYWYHSDNTWAAGGSEGLSLSA